MTSIENIEGKQPHNVEVSLKKRGRLYKMCVLSTMIGIWIESRTKRRNQVRWYQLDKERFAAASTRFRKVLFRLSFN